MSMPPHPGNHQVLLPSLTVLGNDLAADANPRAMIPTAGDRCSRRLPEWLKRPIPAAGGMSFTRSLVAELGLETVCESAKCPNRSECWTRRTATFMILGGVCTRPCGFCAVDRGHPEAVAIDEPDRLAEACHRLGLRHVVITSVTRDDLPDGGAEHFRQCVAGRAQAHRRHDRGPHARLRRPARSDRRRPASPARGLQPQHGNRRAGFSSTCAAKASTP